jgi:hypothetical protein
MKVIGRTTKKPKDQWISKETLVLVERRRQMANGRIDRNKKEFNWLTREIRRQLKTDKNEWIEKQCQEAEAAFKRNKLQEVYKKITQLSGKFELKVSAIKDKNGNILDDNELILQRWKEHFDQLLNVSTDNDPTALDEIPINNKDEDMPDFMESEVKAAISNMKKNKSPGFDGITTELLQGGGETIVKAMHTLVNKIHHEEQIPEDWGKSLIVPIYKRKGDPQDCKNYRGISLQSVPGKVFTKMIHNRMKQYVEEFLGEEQAGFRSGRSTIDQIFTMRQIMEKATEHNQDLFINFIDFRQAFDCIWHEGIWRTMQHAGIPEKMIAMVKNIYGKSMSAIKMDKKITEYFQTKTGVRQGCILSPYLFNLVLEAIMNTSLKNTEVGIKVAGTQMNNLRFADDIGLLATTIPELQHITTEIDKNSRRFGLQINIDKTKVMAVEKKRNKELHINISGKEVEQVDKFVYLGGLITANGSNEEDIQRRIGLTSQAFGKLNKIWRSKGITKNTKIRIYETLIKPILLYGSECWTIRKSDEHRIMVAEMSWLRRIAGITRLHKIRNEEIRAFLNIKATLIDNITERRLRWFGHVERMSSERLPNRALHSRMEEKRSRGRPRTRWIDNVKDDISTMGLSMRQALDLTKCRDEWRSFIHTQRHRTVGDRN